MTTAQTASCCSPAVAATTVDASAAERIAATFKALGDPTRVRLLSLIAASEDAEACICDLTDPVGLTQGTVSHHMRILADAGLVSRDQRGRWAYYAIAQHAFDEAAEAVLCLGAARVPTTSSLGGAGERA